VIASDLAHDAMPRAVRQAYEVLDLWEQNCDLRERLVEAERYRQMYFDLLNESIKHGEIMIGNVIGAMLHPNRLGRIALDGAGEG
jgi:hypothetical protein